MEIMRGMEADSIDAVVCDPPAGINFMGKSWDSDKGGRDKWVAWMSEIASECLRVLKPGGYALVWSLPRTSHWTGMAWENGGFEPRDRLAYCFGSGFPKSLDVSKAIDKAAGAERKTIGKTRGGVEAGGRFGDSHLAEADKWHDVTAPATAAAREWAGWGTALKPAIEDWWVFRKPLSEKTVAENVLKWGCGGLNIDASRIETNDDMGRVGTNPRKALSRAALEHGYRPVDYYKDDDEIKRWGTPQGMGRFPANLITDGSDEVRAMFPQTTSRPGSTTSASRNSDYGMSDKHRPPNEYANDTGSAARFFAVCPLDEGDYPPLYYCAKSSRRERNEGLDDMPTVTAKRTQAGGDNTRGRPIPENKNIHPCCKPLSLMRYLITLCTRPGATVLDPFCGSGSTLVACVQLGRNGIGCDNNAEYIEIAQARVNAAMPIEIELPLFAEMRP